MYLETGIFIVGFGNVIFVYKLARIHPRNEMVYFVYIRGLLQKRQKKEG